MILAAVCILAVIALNLWAFKVPMDHIKSLLGAATILATGYGILLLGQ